LHSIEGLSSPNYYQGDSHWLNLRSDMIIVIPVIIISLLCICHSKRIFFDSLSADIVQDLERSWKLLDHNVDGHVSLRETLIGIATMKQIVIHLDSINDHGSKSQTIVGIDPTISICQSPVPDGPVFIDCIVQSSRRKVVSSGLQFDYIINFEDQLEEYLSHSNCTDESPITAISCNELAGIYRKSYSDIELSKILSVSTSQHELCDYLEKWGHCRFSCRRCGEVGAGIVSRGAVPHREALNRDRLLSDDNSAHVLISSDWHIEPWYEPSITDTVARYSAPTIDNMWNCFGSDADETIPCDINGVSDPPIDFIDSHFQAYQDLENTPGLFFFIGDTQVHDYQGSSIGTCDEPTVISNLMSKALSLMLKYWTKDKIFLCPGNNDGPHSAIFSSGDGLIGEDSKAWADAVLKAGIVNNDLGLKYNYTTTISLNANGGLESQEQVILSQMDFFSNTGYYVKQIDPSNDFGLAEYNLFAISYNTNLGSTNEAQQSALLGDLKKIKDMNGGVYLLGHHPEITMSLIPGKL
jgi:hypothetical protein